MSRFLKITIEHEMEEYEMKEILTENNMKLSDFENEDEAYKYAAETTFNRGLGFLCLAFTIGTAFMTTFMSRPE